MFKLKYFIHKIRLRRFRKGMKKKLDKMTWRDFAPPDDAILQAYDESDAEFLERWKDKQRKRADV